MSRPSTTSSSEPSAALPRLNWRVFWMLIAVFTILCLISLELVSRSLGFVPVRRDSYNFWAAERDLAAGAGADTIALLGASWTQTDIDLETIQDLFPHYRFVQLGVRARSPLPTLVDLAEDPEFQGTVICGLAAFTFSVNKNSQTTHRLFYDTYWREQRWLRLPYLKFVASLEENVTLFHRSGLLRQSLPRLIRGKPIYATAFVIESNRNWRFRSDASERAVIEQLSVSRRAGMFEPTESRTETFDYLSRVEEAVKTIQSRGGKVVFVRWPSSGDRRAREEHHWPKSDYWDPFVQMTSAATLHYEDYPSLKGFTLLDESHIVDRDAPEFTRALANILIEKEILQSPAR